MTGTVELAVTLCANYLGIFSYICYTARMIETTEKERIELRLVQAELKFERRFARLKAAYEERFTALEQEVASIHAMLNDIRNAIDEDFEIFSTANRNRARAIENINDCLADVEDRLAPTFDKAFPQHDAFLGVIDDILKKAGRKSQ